MAEIIDVHQEIELYGMDWYYPTCYATEILDAKYEKVSTDDYVNQLHHLTTQQKEDLKALLNTYKPIGAAPRWHFFVGGGGGVWAKKFVTLRGLRISEKKPYHIVILYHIIM